MNAVMENAYLQPAIRGKIADLQDYPVAAARVFLSGSKLGERLCAQTGIEGYFMFTCIPPGVYTLEVLYSGFSKLVQRGIAVRECAITGLDLKMDFQEDSRSLKLQSLRLNYVNGRPEAGGAEALSPLIQHLHEVTANLNLERALFNPPRVLRVGGAAIVEFGVFQNFREKIRRGLLERKIAVLNGGSIEVSLKADLQASGCRVLPKTLPRVEIKETRYVDWRWELLPQVPGRGLIRLELEVQVIYDGSSESKKCLLVLDRETRIRRSLWLAFQRLLNGWGKTA
jgi:hypothetical protein